MKKIYLIIATLICLNVTMLASEWDEFDYWEDDIELMSAGMTCYNGGRGSLSCSIQSGIEIDDGISTACSVSCGQGFYACCGLKCKCIDVLHISEHPGGDDLP